ncbi:hypothetical protein RYH73_13075 [Olivibacter sp. CPCC 100613]|uniref:hypothetical protein n=1 Tax=Olivibacter sp. CPCC 100613 TaxID=3079931 RepID=UPI002FF4A154
MKKNKDRQLDDLSIPVYQIITDDFEERAMENFSDKPEFDVTRFFFKNKTQSFSQRMWNGMIMAIQSAGEHDDVIVVCSQKHLFTEVYNKDFLVNCIIEANTSGVNLLFGGIGSFTNVVPVTENLFWIDSVTYFDFFIIYRSIFKSILEEQFVENDDFFSKVCSITSNKLTMYPFITNIPTNSYSPKMNSSNNNLRKVQSIYWSYILE